MPICQKYGIRIQILEVIFVSYVRLIQPKIRVPVPSLVIRKLGKITIYQLIRLNCDEDNS